ncbi:MAG TPA: 3-oxoacyl-ACP reductase family protein, partial [Candidatus Polarisedimenticolaceae bacterium]|nr:3-oxoacyl-ACP reductase family protein [Candidatus Polarisedimenticolaceae bacterium]
EPTTENRTMIDLSGKTALVTGGSRGIGKACCELLARAGARVAVNYRVERPWAELLVQRIEERGGQAFCLAADVSRPDEANMMVDETVDRFGRLDVLVNNAGVWRGDPVEEISDNEWHETVAINLTGTFHMIRSAVPYMKSSGGGRIINISSTAGQRGEAFHCHYAATKGAIIALTKSLASELAADGILTNCVAPGWVETDMTEQVLERDRATIVSAIPLRRVARPEEIAAVVVFLASDLSSFINGEVVNVNGGSVLCG